MLHGSVRVTTGSVVVRSGDSFIKFLPHSEVRFSWNEGPEYHVHAIAASRRHDLPPAFEMKYFPRADGTDLPFAGLGFDLAGSVQGLYTCINEQPFPDEPLYHVEVPFANVDSGTLADLTVEASSDFEGAIGEFSVYLGK